MSSQAEVAQTHPDSDADPVLDYIRKGETQYYLNGLHRAVNNFITVLVEQRSPSKAHAVANAPKSPHSCQKLFFWSKTRVQPVHFVFVRDEKSKEHTQKVH